jgi:hypothetical protein
MLRVISFSLIEFIRIKANIIHDNQIRNAQFLESDLDFKRITLIYHQQFSLLNNLLFISYLKEVNTRLFLRIAEILHVFIED